MSKQRHETIAQWIARRIRELDKPQKDIAREVGWPKPNVVTMIKQGSTKVPLDKVGPLARSLEIDPSELFWAVIKEYAPDTFRAIDETTKLVRLRDYEQQVIAMHRCVIGHRKVTDVTLSDDGTHIIVSYIPHGEPRNPE